MKHRTVVQNCNNICLGFTEWNAQIIRLYAIIDKPSLTATKTIASECMFCFPVFFANWHPTLHFSMLFLGKMRNVVLFFHRVERGYFWNLLGWSVQTLILCLKWFSILINISDTSKLMVDLQISNIDAHLKMEFMLNFFPPCGWNKETNYHCEALTTSFTKIFSMQVGYVDCWFGVGGNNWWILRCGLWNLWTQIFELVLSSHYIYM